MDIFTFIILILAGAAILLLGLFLGAALMIYIKRREKESDFERYDETCDDCIFFCPECGCLVDECRPYDSYAIYEDAELIKLKKKTKVVINNEEIQLDGKKPKEYTN